MNHSKSFSNPTSAWETITPEVAKRILEHNNVNRPLSRAQVAHYARQMANGQWRMNGETISISDKGNLVNGQHRLHAIIAADTPVRILVVRGVDENTFATFDGGKNRSLRDVLSIAQIKNANDISTMLQKRQQLILGHLAIGTSGTRTNSNLVIQKMSREDYLNIYNANPELFTEIANKGQSYYAKLRLFSKGEIAAVICFLHIDKGHTMEEVLNFFTALFGEGKSGCNSIVLLRKTIIKDGMSTRRMDGQYKTQLLIKAWNDFVSGNNYRKQLKWDQEREGKLKFL